MFVKNCCARANLMNSRFTEMGVAVAVGAATRMGAYWIQILGTAR